MKGRMHTLAVFPSYDGSRFNGKAIWDLAKSSDEVDFMECQGSCLTSSFNQLWAKALNNRDAGITHFLMVHADVQPLDAKWFQILHSEMEAANADVLSAIIPMKSAKGITTTGLDTNRWRPRRFTIKEIEVKPKTFTEKGLLINTGLLLVDFRAPWVEKITFDVNSKLARKPDGRFYSDTEPEDWHFSRQLMQLGVNYYATRAVKVAHRGQQDFYNYGGWGWDHDNDNDPQEEN